MKKLKWLAAFLALIMLVTSLAACQTPEKPEGETEAETDAEVEINTLFPHGLLAVPAKVGSDKRWGYINTQGDIVIQAEYDIADDFCVDIAFVEKNGKDGVIAEDGATVFLDSDLSTHGSSPMVGTIELNHSTFKRINGQILEFKENVHSLDYDDGFIATIGDKYFGVLDLSGRPIYEYLE